MKTNVITHYDLLIDENNDPVVLSVSREQKNTIDFGTRTIQVFPDDPRGIKSQIENGGLHLLQTIEIENAYIFVSEK